MDEKKLEITSESRQPVMGYVSPGMGVPSGTEVIQQKVNIYTNKDGSGADKS